MGIFFLKSSKPSEGFIHELDCGTIFFSRGGAKKLGKLSGVTLDIDYALVLASESGKRFAAAALTGENRNERVIVIACPGQRNSNLALHPVDDPSTAHIDGEGSGLPLKRLFKLCLPALARLEVFLVEPNL